MSDMSSDLSERVNIASGLKRFTESHPPNSILFCYSSETKCKYPEVSTVSESENAEITEETTAFDGRFRQMCHNTVCDYSSDSSSYQSDPDQSEESLHPFHSVKSCSTAKLKSSMSFSDTSTREIHINDSCIEETLLSTTEDDHRIQFHVDKNHSTAHPCTPILSVKMSDVIAVSDITLNIVQPPVQHYVKFPVTIINQKR